MSRTYAINEVPLMKTVKCNIEYASQHVSVEQWTNLNQNFKNVCFLFWILTWVLTRRIAYSIIFFTFFIGHNYVENACCATTCRARLPGWFLVVQSAYLSGCGPVQCTVYTCLAGFLVPQDTYLSGCGPVQCTVYTCLAGFLVPHDTYLSGCGPV